MRFPSSVLFFLFCLLISGRDVYTSALSKGSGPVFVLFFYCAGATLLSWLVYGLRTQTWNSVELFKRLSAAARLRFLKLGVSTLIVYAATVFGIYQLGTAVFASVDYGAMPVATLIADRIIQRNRISRIQFLGTVVASAGILIFFSGQFGALLSLPNHRIWLGISLLSPAFTAYCTVLQKQQVDAGMPPEEVLLFRFPIPAIAFFTCWGIEGFPHVLPDLPSRALITVFGVFLPLWLLCLAFVRSAVGTLAGFLFLIPVLTFALSLVFLPDQLKVILHPAVILSAGLIVVGCCIFEGLFSKHASPA